MFDRYNPYKRVGVALSHPVGKEGRQQEYHILEHEPTGELLVQYAGYVIGSRQVGLPLADGNFHRNASWNQSRFPTTERFKLTPENWAVVSFFDGREGGFGDLPGTR